MLVPPFGFARGTAEDALPLPRSVFDQSAALLADSHPSRGRVSADVGGYSIDGDAQIFGDACWAIPLSTKVIETFDFILIHRIVLSVR